MSLFCLLWVPLFYFLRRSTASGNGSGHVWALLLGCTAVLIQYFTGPLVVPGGFGYSRWFSGLIDIVGLPVLVPLAVYWLFIVLRILSTDTDYAGFALMWLIPFAVSGTINWHSPGSPVFLVLVPLLWTALGISIPFFINYMIRYPRWYIITASVLCVIALPIIAVTSWWAFFSHQNLIGSVLLSAILMPVIISVAVDFSRKPRERYPEIPDP
ncbi:MAG: hypothetical protein FWG89_04155 [Treponema sp.]|nr:hypothetical protein [Treponema sp.]